MLNPVYYWYQKTNHPITYLFLPFSFIFGRVVALRRFLYIKKILKSHRFKTPVIVVGNITVGGTGKTPLVIELAHFLKSKGFRPGIVSRGVGGKKYTSPRTVSVQDSSADVGDEAILLVKKTNCPLVICTDRVAAVSTLLQQACNIVLADDGLQHYRLERQVEIAVVDAKRGFGNGYLLPAGPLREPKTRIQHVDFVIVNGGECENELTMTLNADKLISVHDGQEINLTDFPRQKIHAVAAIGHPERFFDELKKLGFDIIEHVFPDHYHFKSHDLDFNDGLPIIMTEKDAVKCANFSLKSCWYLTVTAKIDNRFKIKLLEKIEVGDELQKNNSKHTHRFDSDCNQSYFRK